MTTPTPLPAERRRELLRQAEDLAAELAGTAGRTEVSLVANVLFYVPGEWSERLREGRSLLEALSGSGLEDRSKSIPAKHLHLSQHLAPVLAANDSAAELRFLLGWLMRLLVVREKDAKRKAEEAFG